MSKPNAHDSATQLPAHLSGTQAQGLVKGEPIAQFEIGSGKNFVYLVLDWNSKEAALVDPQRDLSLPLKALQEHGFRLTSVCLTHSHHDHIAGLDTLLEAFPGIPVRVGKLDLHRMSQQAQIAPGLKIVSDGETFSVGKLKLQALHTPGHSAGEFSYYLPEGEGVPRPYLFTGDTIFIRDCGRTDFEDGSNEQMFASIQKIKSLPPETVFLVGHHYAKECATTLALELAQSPPFQAISVEALAALP